MSLVIAWRNPRLRGRIERKVRRVVEDQFVAVYLVTEPDTTLSTFELYPGGATKSDEPRRGVVEAGSTLASSRTKEENSDGVVSGCGRQSYEAADPCA
jgi:hypothetical protein